MQLKRNNKLLCISQSLISYIRIGGEATDNNKKITRHLCKSFQELCKSFLSLTQTNLFKYVNMDTLLSTFKWELYLIWNFDKLIFGNTYGSIQNTLHSCVLCKDLVIELYRYIVIQVYRCATCNIKQKKCYIKVQWLDAYEKSVLKKIFGIKRDEVCNRNTERASD